MDPNRYPFQFQKLKPFLKLLTSLLAALLAFNTIGYTCFQPHPSALWMHEWLNPDEKRRVSTQMSAAKRWVEPRSAETQTQSVGLILGLSTSREGIDASQLEQKIGKGLRVANLGSSGGSFQELNYYSDQLNLISLNPDWIILGIHPVWLAGRKPESLQRIRPSDWAERLVSQNVPEKIRLGIRQSFWLVHNHRRMHNWIENILRSTSINPNTWINPSAYSTIPFKTIHHYSNKRASKEYIQTQNHAFNALGWYETGRYALDNHESINLKQILSHCGKASRRVIIVLMPESSLFREHVPALGVSTMRNILCLYPEFEVLDCRTFLNDDDFFDLVHPNSRGRSKLTNRIAAQLLLTPPPR